MDPKAIRKAVGKLSLLVKSMDLAGLQNREGWKAWRKDNPRAIESALGYRRSAGMPSGDHLIRPDFHPELPLVLLNYTPVAHNTLHLFGSQGWTDPLRLCRGIVFERSGRLVALPFPKFFNHGEHPESTDLPDLPFEATVKHDGHLGIVFEYRGQWHLTTRGVFGYRTAQCGQEMLDRTIKSHDWPSLISPDINPLVEIIHPVTKVHLKYRKPRLILIGANDRVACSDYAHKSLRALGRTMGLETTRRWNRGSIRDLEKLMRDLSVRNREGFVVRFMDGRRVKFKFKSYLSLMVGSKLTPHYVMNRAVNGSFDKLMSDLDFEVQAEARAILAQMAEAAGDSADPLKERRQRVYDLLLDPKSQYQRGIARKFISLLDEGE